MFVALGLVDGWLLMGLRSFEWQSSEEQEPWVRQRLLEYLTSRYTDQFAIQEAYRLNKASEPISDILFQLFGPLSGG